MLQKAILAELLAHRSFDAGLITIIIKSRSLTMVLFSSSV